MADDVRVASPPSPYLAGCAAGEGDEFGRGGDENVELFVMGAAVRVMRVPEIVDGVDERLAETIEAFDDAG
jgi:hypothetical protein